MTGHRYIADGHILAEDRIENPHRRIDERDAFDEYVAAAVRLDEVRPELMVGAESSVLGGHILFAHLAQRFAIFGTGRFPVPPCFFSGLAVERTGASDGDVVLVMSVDQR